MPSLRIGISGWTYPPWRGTFYPEGLAHRRELAYAAERVGSIEVNGSFYALQKPDSYRRWRTETPDDFVFSVKGPRFVTHMKQLRDVETPVANFLASGVLALGAKLGPVLWQLPPRMRFNPARLSSFLDLLPHTTSAAASLARKHDERLDDRALTETDADRPLRHAIEPRHESFRDPAFSSMLREHGVALVLSDSAGVWPVFDEPTTDLVYVRLHGQGELYVGGYTADALDGWAEKIRAWSGEGRDVVTYFDNDVKVHAPNDAMALAARLA